MVRHLLCVAILVACAAAYKPIICMHGFSYNNNDGTFHDYDDIKGWLAEAHPGQLVVSLNFNNGKDSMHSLLTQLPGLVALIRSTVANNASFANGYHFLGHSQGGLLMRCVLEAMDNHNVDTFVSMAGVQMGVYGYNMSFLPNLTEEALSDLLYTSPMQHSFSVANFWNDARDQKRFATENLYLPVLNNIVPHNNTARYKSNFMNVNRMFYFGSPNDGTVRPWQSSQWAAEDASLNIVPMEQQQVFLQDTFGLRSMYTSGKLTLHPVPGIEHAQWLHNKTNFLTYVAPLLT